jgi:hypothetical protein
VSGAPALIDESAFHRMDLWMMSVAPGEVAARALSGE